MLPSLSSLLVNQEYFFFSLVIQKLLSDPLRTSALYHATQIDPEFENRSHMSLREHALFQATRSRHPKPPSSLARVTVSHETLAEWLPSALPCHKNAPQRELIFEIHAFAKTKVEDQKLVIPAITVLSRRSRPANERERVLQELTLSLMCWRRGAQLWRESFWEQRGMPRYLTGKEP